MIVQISDLALNGSKKNIKSLLDEAGRVGERYGLKADKARGSEVSASRGIDAFKDSFDRFKSQIRRNQKETTAWNVTRWAIHDAGKFGGMINRLEKFVDGLESITKSLGLLQEQHALRMSKVSDCFAMHRAIALLNEMFSIQPVEG